MPAVTTSDISSLPRVADPSVAQMRQRPVKSLTDAPTGYEGEGFPVRRGFAGVSLADLDPFVHMDQMGEIEYAPGEPKGTPWHPHRGFETVTYMMDGTFLHQDSHGGGGAITDGGTQWMTAGSGILHIETPPEDLVVRGGLFHGVQLWVNLASKDKMLQPAYQSLDAERVELLASHEGASLVRLIAGDLAGTVGPGSTHSPMSLIHASVSPDSELRLPWSPSFNALAYVLAGSGSVGAEGLDIRTGNLVVFGPGEWMSFSASPVRSDASDTLELLIMGGEPIREPVAHYGPFVMNTQAELEQAMADFRSGKLGTVPPGALMPFHVN